MNFKSVLPFSNVFPNIFWNIIQELIQQTFFTKILYSSSCLEIRFSPWHTYLAVLDWTFSVLLQLGIYKIFLASWVNQHHFEKLYYYCVTHTRCFVAWKDWWHFCITTSTRRYRYILPPCTLKESLLDTLNDPHWTIWTNQWS